MRSRCRCCPALKMPMKAALARPMWGYLRPRSRVGCGALVVGVPLVVGEVPVSGVGVFGDGGAGGLLVDDGFAGGEGSDQWSTPASVEAQLCG